ncbi:DUF885 family protein [Chromatocurvus halotolerans]|uniref:Uncharacterized protein DUF885 n=1 Tax=Chromatocurvus halotolerans TaxID=1132028 RepID=A0A4V6NPF5_9GAMM|nr:DUF885 family protein [Chromatocurvus halotolerans]TCO77020.1 uncharacterized protein DUF885 [Chromatocurvus halotolerans]
MKNLKGLLLVSVACAFCAGAFAQSSYERLVQMNEEILALAKPAVIEGVPDLSPATIAAQREALEDFEARLREIDTAGWEVSRQIDYLLVWSKMNAIVFNHRVMQPWSRDPLTYLYHFRGIPHAEVPATPEERAALADRLKAVPAMVDRAIVNLTQPAGELAELAIFLLDNFDGVGQGEPYRDEPPEGTIGWFKDLCGRLEGQNGSLVDACRRATAAAQQYHDWLADNLDSMQASAAIGADNFNWYLKHVRLLPQTVDDLRGIGEREFHRYRFNYLLDRHVNAPLEELELTRSAEQHRQRTRQAEADTRKLVRDLKLFTIPDDMPDEFESDVFWSPRAETDRHFWEEIQFRNALNNHIHASIPGHRFDSRLRERLTNPIRRTHGESARAEGWATYLEETLIQAGIAKDNPRVRELFYAALIKRGSRFFAEIGMHTGTMTLEEANAYMMDWVPYMEEDLGRYDLVGYLRRPGLGSMYLLGKTQIEQLISERAFQLGDDFDLGEFHDDFLSRGIIPVTLIRWEMAGLDDSARAVWADVVGKPFPGDQ